MSKINFVDAGTASSVKPVTPVTLSLKVPVMIDGVARTDIVLDVHDLAQIAQSGIGMCICFLSRG